MDITLKRFPYLLLVILANIAVPLSGKAGDAVGQSDPRVVFTQIPRRAISGLSQKAPRFLPPLRNISGSRIASIDLSRGKRSFCVLTEEFASACSPIVSFDGKRVVFAGRRGPNEPWNLWEMNADGGNKRRIVETPFDCLTPAYLPSIYTLDDLTPRDQVVFASAPGGALNDSGHGEAWSLHTCELTGKNLRQISFNLSADFDPAVLPDGRIVFTSWQNYGARYYPVGLFPLLSLNTDGTDLFTFYGNHELPILKCKPAVGHEGWIYFVESDGFDPLGGGSIAAVNLSGNLKTYTPIVGAEAGLYYSPFPLSEGKLLVSYKRKSRRATYGLYELSPDSGQITRKVFDDPAWHDVEAQTLLPRNRPKGRSSVVNYDFDFAWIFCLNCYLSDWPEMQRVARGSLRRLRVIEGIPLRVDSADLRLPEGNPVSPRGIAKYSATPFGPRRILGEAPLYKDGSFYIKVPGETPIAFQVLDENDTAVVTHRNWMWSMPKEIRGCIGCHEDRERTPPNRLTEALKKPAAGLNVPVEKRRTVDFQHEIAPLIKTRCLRCHTRDHPLLDLTGVEKGAELKDARWHFPRAYEVLLSPPAAGTEGIGGRYIKPGSARESPLVWRLFGSRLSKPKGRPDTGSSPAMMPPKTPLNDSERRLFIEWIDLGAQWNNRPSPENVAKHPFAPKATGKEK